MFFGVIYLANWLYMGICKKNNAKILPVYKTILLVESYIFIIISDWKTAISIIVLTAVCYLVVGGVCKFRERKNVSKCIYLCGLIIAIGQLCFFKYYDFLAQNICKILNLSYTSNHTYIPLGISFFTFSAVAYLTDVYKSKYDAYKGFGDLALYLAFFPKLISGPIVRPEQFNKQVYGGYCKVNINNLQEGIQIVVWGLFKKMVLADHLAIFVNDVFGAPSAFNSMTCIWAMISYSLQIYFDFSGYSDMAIGFSKMLGIDIDKNFDLPYISKNVTEFWKRWHISLSSWLQEYVYISLGGNRKGKVRTKINLILTMLIGGLWHGANWTFIVWGAIHGIALVVQKKFRAMCKKFNVLNDKTSVIKDVCSICFTFIFVTITWVFFRATSLMNAFQMLLRAVTFEKGVVQIYSWTWFALAFVIYEVGIAILHRDKQSNSIICMKYPILRLNTIKNLLVFFCFVGLTIILAYVGNTAFIYGKF